MPRLLLVPVLLAAGCASTDANSVCTTLAKASAVLARKAAGCGAAESAVPPPQHCPAGNVASNCATDANNYAACVNELPNCTPETGVTWVVKEINCQRALTTAAIDCNGNGT